MRKGDRVEFEMGEDTHYGVVGRKRGKTLTVVLDGGKTEVTGYERVFRLSAKPLKIDGPEGLEQWTVTGFQEQAGGAETQRFVATIRRDGKPVCDVSNDGNGGCNRYSRPNVFRELQDHIDAWLARSGFDREVESVDMWVGWQCCARGFGVEFADYIRDRDAMIAGGGEQLAPTPPRAY